MRVIPKREMFTTVYVNDFEKWLMVILQMFHSTAEICACKNKVKINKKWIFRGQSNSEWGLSTSFERLIIENGYLHLSELQLRTAEILAIENFKREAAMSYQSRYDDKIEWLGLMQHYGAPTRLLDFTESPFIALYFATCTRENKDFSVWAILPSEMNQKVNVLKEMCSNKDTPTDINIFLNRLQESGKQKNFLRNFGEKLDKTEKNWLLANKFLERKPSGLPYRSKKSKVIEVRLKQNNTRINAQAGLFLMPSTLANSFWDNLKSSFNELKDNPNPFVVTNEMLINNFVDIEDQSYVIKFVFESRLKDIAKRFLEISNINAKTLFPGLEGIAQSVNYFKDVDIDAFQKFLYNFKARNRV